LLFNSINVSFSLIEYLLRLIDQKIIVQHSKTLDNGSSIIPMLQFSNVAISTINKNPYKKKDPLRLFEEGSHPKNSKFFIEN